MNNFQRLAAIFLLSLMLLACSDGSVANSDSSSGSAAGGGVYPAMGVGELDKFLADNKGTPTILLFWTTWCPSCKQEIPEMEELIKTHGSKVNIISVSLDEKVEALDAFFKGKSTNLPVYHGDQDMARKFNVEAIPTLVMFDKEGNQVFSRPGVFPLDMLQAMADKLAE